MNNIKTSENKLKFLEDSIKGLGKEGFPFRHKDYSLNTCVPCSDFSNWIINQLEENDIWAIKLLQWEIKKGSGLMVGTPELGGDTRRTPEKDVFFWKSCIIIDADLSKDISKYIITSPEILNEIYCLFIRSDVSVEAAYGYFYNPNEYTYNYHLMTFADALCCHQINFNIQNIAIELDQANTKYKQYMNEYRNEKNVSDMFTEKDLNIDYSLIDNNELAIIMSKLPIGTRLHFWDLVNSLYFIDNIRMNRRKNLECWFRTNTFGFDKINSNNNLIEAGLIKFLDKKEIVISLLKKNELLDLLKKFKIILKPNISKDKIIKIIYTLENRTDLQNYIIDYARIKGLYRFNNLFEKELANLLEYKKQLVKVLLLLCTVDFGNIDFRKSFFLNDNGKYYIVYDDGEKIRLTYK